MWSRAGVVAAAGLVVLAAGAGAQEPPRQTYTERFTTDVPGAASGRVYSIDYLSPGGDPEAKPHAFSRLRVVLPEGARFDTAAVPRCAATDAELIADGPSACPPESRVGSDETVVDTGVPGPGRHFTTDFAFFNNADELILLATAREYGARVVVRGRVGERTLDIDNPVIPGTPPDGAAARSQRGTFEPRAGVRDGRQANYITTPPTCPPSGHWVHRVEYTYRDGVEQSAESRSPCRRPADTRPPALAATGIPRACTRRTFRAHVRIADESRLRIARVRLDGRAVATSAHRRIGVNVRAARMSPGRHTITVAATDAAGNRAERSFAFRRC